MMLVGTIIIDVGLDVFICMVNFGFTKFDVLKFFWNCMAGSRRDLALICRSCWICFLA